MARKPSDEKIAWGVGAYGHDWRAEGFVEHLLRQACSLGLIGSIETLDIGYDLKPKSPPPHAPDSVPDLLAREFWSQTGPAQLGAAGSQPYPWELRLTFLPVGHADPIIGSALLSVSAAALATVSSDRLWQAFRATHGSSNTSYAFIHPRSDWVNTRARQQPLINSATFETILWANFIGGDLLSRFFLDKLTGLDEDAETVERGEDGGLFLRLNKDLGDLLDRDKRKAIESRRSELARRFKAARVY